MLSSELIKKAAEELGFSACGICRAEKMEKSYSYYVRKFIDEGRNGEMEYLARNIDMRLDPAKLVEGTKSIISVALNYYPARKMNGEGYTFSYYAYGKDYHAVVKEKLFELLRRIRKYGGDKISGRAFCDTAPVSERYWAWRAGVGFIGKNTLLIIPRKGSFFFLGELFINAEFDKYDEPLQNMCGNCTKCIDVCPGKALYKPYHIDARKCISYLTIEKKGELPPGTAGKMENCIYGCDRCQSVCPHNRFSTPTNVGEFAPNEKLLDMKRDEWNSLTEEEYRELFRGSAVKRAKYSGLMRNINAVNGKEKKADKISSNGKT